MSEWDKLTNAEMRRKAMLEPPEVIGNGVKQIRLLAACVREEREIYHRNTDEIFSLMRELDQLRKKVAHGCTDATCEECDG